jgi:NAD(P)-dependent dehydrogenase (short-subunit alcohol dehydrogenase family)
VLSQLNTATGAAHTLDESAQPIDASGSNSWSRRLHEVSTPELVQTMVVNSVAPFILAARLKPLLAPRQEGDPLGHIVNVSSLEGKFNVGKKSTHHPHTNSAKAALNMMTLTSARDYARSGILMNAVDTGWITDMAPLGAGASARVHEAFVGPPLDEVDGAARILDPLFVHVQSGGKEKMVGLFLKDYMSASW